MFFAIASLGLPGLGNFVAEFLVLAGSFRASAWMTVIATLGLVTAVVYSLWLVQRAFQGTPREEWRIGDLGSREMSTLLAMAALLVLLGLYPQPVLNTAEPVMKPLQREIVAPVPARVALSPLTEEASR